MGGKAALILVLGVSSVILMIGLNMNRVSLSSVDNSTSYYESQIAKEIAKSGINLATSNIARDPAWDASGSPYSYLGSNDLEITVNDTGDIKIVTSVGTFEDKSKLIEVKIKVASFSEYAYFSNVEGNIWWAAGDSVFGPFHTNDHMQVWQHPYFAGPSTSHGGPLKYMTNEANDSPTIVGSYTTGITIDIPTDGISELQSSAQNGGVELLGSEISLEFVSDSIRYKLKSGDDYTTVLGSDFAPNGVIYVKNADLRIKGTVKGKWSIGSNRDVYIDDDIVYSEVPDYTDDSDPSQDLLGIISKNDVIVANTTANENDVNIHAAIYCQDGSFTVEDYNIGAVRGDINLIGGITQEQRGPVATGRYVRGAVQLTHGFHKNYKYDSRLLKMVPPYFPSTRTFKVISWLE